MKGLLHVANYNVKRVKQHNAYFDFGACVVTLVGFNECPIGTKVDTINGMTIFVMFIAFWIGLLLEVRVSDCREVAKVLRVERIYPIHLFYNRTSNEEV
jgi:hypothetical protein